MMRLFALLFLCLAFPAFAQQKSHAPQPALTATVGGISGVQYQDNLTRAPQATESDFIGILKPGFRLDGNLKPYRLRVEGMVERGEYLSETRHDYTDADLRWRLHHDREDLNRYYTDGRFRYDHVGIGAFADDPADQAAEPAPYRYLEGGLGWERDSADWIGGAEIRGLLHNYDNVPRVGGLTVLNDDRDYAQHQLTLRGGYYIRPQTALYVQSSLNQRRYDKRVDVTRLEPHDSGGYELLGGLRWHRPEDALSAELALGALHQDYDAASLKDVTAPALRGLLQWRPSPEMRLRAEAAREVREAVALATSAYLQSRLRLRGDYQLAPEWRIGASLRFSENEFQIAPVRGIPPRTDRIWDGGLSLDYALRENMTLGLDWLRVLRASDDPLSEYDSNLFLLRLGANY